jgi:hypothetical protein
VVHAEASQLCHGGVATEDLDDICGWDQRFERRLGRVSEEHLHSRIHGLQQPEARIYVMFCCNGCGILFVLCRSAGRATFNLRTIAF